MAASEEILLNENNQELNFVIHIGSHTGCIFVIV